jgi:hypothetical protein
MKLFFLILICISPIIAHGQVSAVKEKVENSYKHYEAALKEIKYAVSQLEICENSRSSDAIQNFASDANEALRTARNFIDYAKDQANNAKIEASEIACSTTEEQADGARHYFHDAEDRLRSAMGQLRNVRYNKNKDISRLQSCMADAKNYIDQGLIRLNYAVIKLNDVLLALENCN